MIYTRTMDTPLGSMLAAAEGEALTGLWFIGQKYFPRDAAKWTQRPDDPVFKALRLWLTDYFGKKNPRWQAPLEPRGTPFQRKVWKRLREIPYGEITSYGSIAAGIGSEKAAQAVGGAVGRNPVSLVIPCHRVLGVSGGKAGGYSLTGYAGGLGRKKALLELEGCDWET
jgi:methylated-DNA-[protein]-cysteine S-methyltransferase